MRCQDAGSLITSKLNPLNGIGLREKRIHINNYGDIALKTYIRGLPVQIQINVRLYIKCTLNNQNSFKPDNRFAPLNSQPLMRQNSTFSPKYSNMHFNNMPQHNTHYSYQSSNLNNQLQQRRFQPHNLVRNHETNF